MSDGERRRAAEIPEPGLPPLPWPFWQVLLAYQSGSWSLPTARLLPEGGLICPCSWALPGPPPWRGPLRKAPGRGAEAEQTEGMGRPPWAGFPGGQGEWVSLDGATGETPC